MTKKAASILLSPLCFWPADCLHSLFSTYLLCLCLKHISDHLVRLPGEPVWATDRSQLTVIPPCTLPMLKIKCPKYKSLTLSTQMCDNIAPHVQLFFALSTLMCDNMIISNLMFNFFLPKGQRLYTKLSGIAVL